MESLHPFWSEEQQQAYTEVALVVCAKGGRERLTPRGIVQHLSRDSIRWAGQLSHGHDETFRDTFMSMLHRDRILGYEPSSGKYELGEWGDLLVTKYLEEMIDDSHS
jgi:hypothetical protein